MSKLFAAVGKGNLSIYAIIYKNGELWNSNSQVLESFNSSNWLDYKIDLIEQGMTGVYTVDIPTSLPSGSYFVIYRESLSSAYEESDRWVALEQFDWDGEDRVDSLNLADRFLLRNLGGGSDGGRTVQDSLRVNRNKVAMDVPSVGFLTVYEEDDTTPAFTASYTRGSNELGTVTGVDPA